MDRNKAPLQELLEDLQTPAPVSAADEMSGTYVMWPDSMWVGPLLSSKIWASPLPQDQYYIPHDVIQMGVDFDHVNGTRMTITFVRLALEAPEAIRKLHELKNSLEND